MKRKIFIKFAKKMLLYKSKYFFVNFLEVQYLMHFKFTDACKNLNTNELKAEFLLFFDKMVKRRARHFLIDAENIEHLLDINIVNWLNINILPLIKSVKADKIAWIIQTQKNFDFKSQNIENKSFDKHDKAIKWLLQNAERKKLSFENGRTPPSHHHHTHKKS